MALFLLIGKPTQLSSSPFFLEGRVALFVPESKLFRDLYDVSPYYQLEASYRCHPVYSYFANISYLNKMGHSIPDGDDTEIQLVPISVGVKRHFQFSKKCEAYLGIGPCFTFTRIYDYSPFAIRPVKKENFGVIIKSGITRTFGKCRASLFVDYHNQTIHFHGIEQGVERFSAKIGGFLFGLGIGVKI